MKAVLRCGAQRALAVLIPALLLAGALAAASAVVGSRVKDLARVKGARENQLVGYGLVVGLTGTGDKSGTGFTLKSMSSMLEAMGITIKPGEINVKNVAAVLVTATLPPFAREGSRIDVTVSSLGDAKSLKGGILVQTPLRGADGRVYAVAQGPLVLGGFGAEAPGGTAATTNHLTVARIPGGAIVEREVPCDFIEHGSFQIVLNQPDFTTASRLADAIRRTWPSAGAEIVDAGTIRVTSPDTSSQGALQFLAAVENLSVVPADRARVVINERTGTIVAGGEVVIHPVAIAHGNLNIKVSSSPMVSQPGPFSGGETVLYNRAELSVSSEGGKFTVMEAGTTLNEIANALNAMGVSARDMIAIFQAIKEAGALQAELVVL